MSTSFLRTPLASVLGGRTATALSKGLGLTSAEDLLRHYPRRYAERGELTDLSALVEGERVTVLAEISEVKIRPMRNRRGTILEAVVTDERSSMSVTFFNQKWREREFRAGRRGLFAGQVSSFRGKRQLTHPECILFPDGVTDDAVSVAAFAGALIPIYPAAGSVTTWQIQSSVGILLDQLSDLPDPLRAQRAEPQEGSRP